MIEKLIAWLVVAVAGAAWAYLYSLTSGTEQGLFLFGSLLAVVVTTRRRKCQDKQQPVEG